MRASAVNSHRRLDLQRVAFALKAMSWAIAALGVFWLPWFFGATTPVNGESYVLGFNNRVSVLSLALAMAMAFGSQVLDRKKGFPLRWIEHRVRTCGLKDSPHEYLVFGVWAIAWSILLWSWGNYLSDPGWGDTRIYHHCMSLIALGQVPHRDFMWNYGPAQLYLPYWLSIFTGGDLSFERSYLIFVVLFNLVGYAGIFLITRALVLPQASRPLVLALALLAWAELQLSLMYSSLRFVIVPAGFIFMHEAILRGRATERHRAACVFAAAIVMAAALAISPEMGIAAALGVTAYAFILVLRGEWIAAMSIVIGCGTPVVLTIMALPDYFLSVKAFASGQYNFPVYPTLNNVTLVAAALLVIPSLIVAALFRPFDKRAPLAMALAVGAGMLLPAAFGRADPIHVSFNGVVPTLVMFAAASAAGTTWLHRWMLTYAIVLIGAVQVSYWSVFSGYFRDAIAMRRFYDANPAAVAEWKNDWDLLRSKHPLGHRLHWGKVLPYPKDLDTIRNKGLVIQTAGDEWNLWLGRYLLLQPEAPRDYFHPWTQGAVTPPQLDQKVKVCRQAQYLLIPEAVLSPLGGPIDLDAYAGHLDKFFSGMLVFPVRCKPKHQPFQPETEVAKRLLEDFTPIGRFQFFMYAPFIVCEKKSPP